MREFSSVSMGESSRDSRVKGGLMRCLSRLIHFLPLQLLSLQGLMTMEAEEVVQFCSFVEDLIPSYPISFLIQPAIALRPNDVMFTITTYLC